MKTLYFEICLAMAASCTTGEKSSSSDSTADSVPVTDATAAPSTAAPLTIQKNANQTRHYQEPCDDSEPSLGKKAGPQVEVGVEKSLPEPRTRSGKAHAYTRHPCAKK
jgi:hypothetical protein